MKWLNKSEVQAFLSKQNLDIRKSHNGRWIDQKCTADVVCIVADCIVNFVNENNEIEFTNKDIWYSKYSVENVNAIFKKADVEDEKAKHEYDKFFPQPIKMLANAGILSERKSGNKNIYSVLNYDLLYFISIRERNALEFLNLYIIKVLQDSNLYQVFDNFLCNPTKTSYQIMRNTYFEFIINHTPIKGKFERGRIFTKVINPLAYFRNTKGSEGGDISKDNISYDMLMYNRDNFRDIYAEKPKSMTRKEYAEQVGIKVDAAYFAYLSNKAKRQVRLFNDTFRDSRTELYDARHLNDKAVHIHHIFSESEYPEISAYYENLIALTPTQHLGYAHPDGNTKLIDRMFQQQCLFAKTAIIKDNILGKLGVVFYEFGKYKFVLRTGLDDLSFLEIEENDFDGLLTRINLVY